MLVISMSWLKLRTTDFFSYNHLLIIKKAFEYALYDYFHDIKLKGCDQSCRTLQRDIILRLQFRVDLQDGFQEKDLLMCLANIKPSQLTMVRFAGG